LGRINYAFAGQIPVHVQRPERLLFAFAESSVTSFPFVHRQEWHQPEKLFPKAASLDVKIRAGGDNSGNQFTEQLPVLSPLAAYNIYVVAQETKGGARTGPINAPPM